MRRQEIEFSAGGAVGVDTSMPIQPTPEAIARIEHIKVINACVKCQHAKSQHANGMFFPPCEVEGCRCYSFKAVALEGGNIDTEAQDDIVCPYCSEIYHPDCEDGLYEEDNEVEVTCSKCELEYVAWCYSINFSYSTKPGMTPEEKEAERERQRQERIDAAKRQNEYVSKKMMEGNTTFGLCCGACGVHTDEKLNSRWVTEEQLAEAHDGPKISYDTLETPLVVTFVCDACAAENEGEIRAIQGRFGGTKHRVGDYATKRYRKGDGQWVLAAIKEKQK